MTHEDFGLRLKSIRRYNKLTQEQIAKKLNISRQAYSNYEQGRCYPSPDVLAAISVILKTDLFSFFLIDAFLNISEKEPFAKKSKALTDDEYNTFIYLYSKLTPSEKINLSKIHSKESEALLCYPKLSQKY